MTSRNKRQRAIGLGALLVLAGGLIVPTTASAAEVPDYFKQVTPPNSQNYEVLVENLPGLRDQPASSTGGQISELRYHNGRIYVGYGDYTANTGPIDLYSYDPATGDPQLEINVPTEAIEAFTELNGDLYVPYIDPRAPWTSKVGYASDRTGSWQLHEPAPMIHHYDMETTDGRNLFMAGSLNEGSTYYAVIWYSPDGANDWQIIRKVKSPTNRDEFDRFYWLEASGGKLYAMADVAGPKTLDVWENGSWSSTPVTNEEFAALNRMKSGEVALIGDRLVTTSYVPTDPERFGGAVYSLSAKRLINSDEITSSVPANGERFVALEKRGSTLYAMTLQGKLFSTTDGINWTYVMGVGTIPENFTVDEAGKRVFFSPLPNEGAKIYSAAMADSGIPDIILPHEGAVTAGANWNPMEGVRGVDGDGNDITDQIELGKLTKEDYSGLDFAENEFLQSYTLRLSNGAQVVVYVKVTSTAPVVTPPVNVGGHKAGFCMRAIDADGQVIGYAGDKSCRLNG